MTKKPAAPAPKPPRPPLPSEGGSYIRQPDGSLQAAPKPVKTPVKEASNAD